MRLRIPKTIIFQLLTLIFFENGKTTQFNYMLSFVIRQSKFATKISQYIVDSMVKMRMYGSTAP
jgi:hypothetical protein